MRGFHLLFAAFVGFVLAFPGCGSGDDGGAPPALCGGRACAPDGGGAGGRAGQGGTGAGGSTSGNGGVLGNGGSVSGSGGQVDAGGGSGGTGAGGSGGAAGGGSGDSGAGGSGGSAAGGSGGSGTGGSSGRSTGGTGGAGTGGTGGAGTGGTGGAGTGGTGGSPSVPDYTLVVDAPANQSSVQGTVTVRGRAPRFLNVEVWDATHSNPPLARATPSTADGAFTTSVNAAALTQGATTWTVRAWDSPAGQPFNRSAQVTLNLTITGTNGDGGGSSSCANRRGAPGHVAPTCVKKALIGGGFLNLSAWAQRLGRPSLDIQAQWDDVLAAPAGQGAAADWNWVAGHYSTNQHVVQAGWQGALALGVPMWMRGQSPQICASGQNDQQMTRAMTTLRDMIGARDVYIRLGWEFNADWYPTQASQGDAAYQQAWRDCWVRWYDIVKAVNPKWMLAWNPNWANKGACQSGYTSVLNLWPGAEFVDAAGPDQYDANWCGRPAAYNEMDGEQPIGIGAWADWVIKQGVPFAVPEWGVDSGQWGSGDRPQFIRDMYAAFKKAHQSDSGLAMQMYFDGGTTFTCRFSLLDSACNKNPLSSAEYFNLFRTWPPN